MGRIGLREAVEVLERFIDASDRTRLRESSIAGFTQLLKLARARQDSGVECPCDCSGYPSPAVTVDLVVEDGDGRILLVRRGRDPYKARWALPGGYVECGENVLESARREAREETGLEVEIEGLVGVYSDPGRDPRGHTVSITYRARVDGDAVPRGGDDAAEAGFFHPEEIEGMELAFDHNAVIRDYLEARR
ncbi:MAG: NUDIX hydrolase [Euryarchaeota archaeon]|nr:NUDIX hydrolase [Euryarchaeota archaeon]